MSTITKTDGAGKAVEIDGRRVLVGPFDTRGKAAIAMAEKGMEMVTRSHQTLTGDYVEVDGQYYAVEDSTKKEE